MKTQGTRAEKKVKTEGSASVSLNTTIKISEDTNKLLRQRKLDTDANNIDEVIRELLGVTQ